MAQQFDGKVAFVTGAATGIGRETALAFAAAGARVIAADWNAAAGEETCQAITAVGGEALFVRCDVSRTDQVAAAIGRAVAHFGRLDCAFNNAGIAARGTPVHVMDEDQWDRTIAVNLKGVWACLKHECAQLIAQGTGGAIVNTSSIMGVASGPGLADYSAAKAGVIGLTKAVALDYARHGIRVNAVCPGGIGQTGITSAAENLADMAALAQATPMGSLGEPQDIAGAVLWLCSPQAKFVTGQALVIDGGFTVW